MSDLWVERNEIEAFWLNSHKFINKKAIIHNIKIKLPNSLLTGIYSNNKYGTKLTLRLNNKPIYYINYLTKEFYTDTVLVPKMEKPITEKEII